jgi:hypothetical protein
MVEARARVDKFGPIKTPLDKEQIDVIRFDSVGSVKAISRLSE